MEAQIIKCQQIKQLLQRLSGVEDIGAKSNDRTLSDLRKAYCYLARRYSKASLASIGKVIREDFDHATVIYNIKKFKELSPSGSLECMDEYDKANKQLASLEDEYRDIEEEIKNTYSPNPELRYKYIETLMNLIIRNHSIIINRDFKIKELEAKIKDFEKIVFDL